MWRRAEHIFRNDVVVGDRQDIGVLMQVGDLLRHFHAAAELRLHGHVRVLLFVERGRLFERHRQRAGGENRQRGRLGRLNEDRRRRGADQARRRDGN